YLCSENEDGSLPLVTKHWANYPADLVFNFYIWNMLYEGALPRVVEQGPYTYICGESKDNLTWSSDGNEV
ncbi:hypothetical protein PFISCL1PPCAC_26105, partial [Pristionchus fissidentatus]